MNKPLTTQDIADHLKISRRTVSSVLNGKARERRISEKTIKQVQDYVRKTDFHQDIGALTLRGKHSIDVAIIIRPHFYFEQQEIYFRLIEFLEGAQLSYVTISLPNNNQGRFCQELKAHNPKRVIVFAYFFVSSSLQQLWADIRNTYIPDVHCFYHYAPGRATLNGLLKEKDSASFISGDSHLKQSLDFLINRGFEKVFIPDSFHKFPFKKDVLTQYENCSLQIKEYKTSAIFTQDNFYSDKLVLLGRNIAEQLLRHGSFNGKSAAIIHDEYAAVACINHLQQHKIEIPRDMLIISGPVSETTKLYNYPRIYCRYPFEEMYLTMREWLENKKPGQTLSGFPVKLENEGVIA